MDRKVKVWVILLGIFLVISILVNVFLAWTILRKPLGPTLAVSTAIPTDGPPSTQPTEAPEPSVQPVCGHTEPMMLLILLTGRSDTEPSHQALALRLAKVDFVNRSVVSVFFPRELKITVQGLESLEVNEARIDEIYRYGMEILNDDRAAATSLVAQALYDNFETLPDHYITLDLTRLAGLIDAVGGVDVQILSAYDATTYGLPHFQPGEMYMEGELALAFAASASLETRWEGLDRQTQVLKALRDKALSPSILPQAPELIGQFQSAVTTDLSIQQGLDLACLAEQVFADQVNFSGVGIDLVIPQPDGSLMPDVEAIKAMLVEEFRNPDL